MGFMDEYYKALQDDSAKGGSGGGSSGGSGGSNFMAEYNKAVGQTRSSSPKASFFTGDLAPISARKKKKKKEEERSWFKKGLFEDGYDFGDISRTILGSTTDVLENVGSGIIGMGEKAVDAMAYIAPYAANGQFYQNGGFNLETEKAHREAVEQSKKDLGKFIAKDLYDEEKVARAIISDPARKIGIDSETQSVFGEKSDALIQSGGQLLATAGLQAVGVPWFVTTGATSFGGEAENAMNQGATYEEAGASAAISAGAEILSEKLSGGISFGGKTLDDALTKQLTKGISNKLGRTAAKLGLDMAGEGAEEVFSQIASNLGSSLYKEESLNDLLFSEEAFDEYLESFIGGAALGGVAGGFNAVKSNSKGIDYASGLTQNEQKVVDKLYQDEIANQELTQKEKSKIYDSILEDMEKGYISTDTIEEVLGGDTYSTYKKTVDTEDAILKEYDELGEKQNATPKDYARYTELTEKVKNIHSNSQRNALRAKLNEDVMGLVQGSRLAESYNERARTGQKYEADLTQYDAKQQAVVQKAIDSGILNNSNRTHEFVDFVSKISADTGVLFDFSNTAKIREAGFAVEGQTVDGFITKDGITVNIDSPKSRQFVVGHEITHALEGSELYDALRKSVFDYAKMKNQYGVRMESIQKRYKEGTDFEAELTADLVGEYIFSDTDFINNLSTQNRNVFQKVYDEIKYLCKVATAGSKEARELEKVKRTFEKVYREGGKTHGETKYSVSDSAGKELTAEQQEYFKDSKMRDENGNLKVMYHGTPNGNFTVFKDGTYFTDNKEYADRYQNPSASSISTGKETKNPKTFEVYLDIKKPFDINDEEARNIYINDYIKGGNAMGINPYLSDAEYAKINSIDWTEGEDLRDFLIDNEYDYDGLVLDEGGTGGYGDEVQSRGKSYVVFSPEQVKNIDNTKPTADPDIRFSLSEPVEETKDLLAVHNLTSEQVLKSLELGGLPMPSIAVLKADSVHDEYGDVSLILPKESIDPKANRSNKVYGGDAWTPVYPRIEYKPNAKVEKKISDKYYGLARRIGYDAVRPLYNYVTDLERQLNNASGETAMLKKLYDDTDMMNLYLQDSGKGKIELIEKETVTKISQAEAEMNQFFIDALGKDVIESVWCPKGVHPAEHRKAFMAQNKTAIEDAYKRYCMEEFNFTEEEAENVVVNTSQRDLITFVRDAARYIQNNGVAVKTEIDRQATEEAIRTAAADGYKEWVDGLFKGVEEKTGIRNNQDYYTRSGNPRSWDVLHWENTLENVVKVMKGQEETGTGSMSPYNSFASLAHKRYGSIAEIKADSNRLGKISQEEYEALGESFGNRFAGIAESIKDPAERNPFIALDNAAETIVEAVRTQKTKAGMLSYLQKWSKRVTQQTVDDVVALVNDIANMPTGYFEAKPQRAVGLEEVGVFVIPYDADVKLKQELLNKGYSIAEYDPKVEGDRQRVVNQFEEYKFSLSNVGEQHTPDSLSALRLETTEESTDIAPTASETERVPVEAPIYESNDKSAPEGQTAMFEPVEETPQRTTRKEYHQSIIDNIKERFDEKGFDFDKVLKRAKNLSTWSTVDNTPQRVMEKALGYKEGGILADITVNKVAQNETEGIKWLNSYVKQLKQISKQYGIKPGSKESAAAQMFAEGFYVNENNEIIRYGEPELIQDFGNADVRRRIKGLARDPRIRKIYDDTLGNINESRARNLYPEIPRLDNYFLHFRAMEDTFSTLGLPFNPNDIRAKDLPTDLNGVTADLKPGQPYFASANHRTGKRTSFDLLGGVERYLNSAKNQIYHIDDIQTLRALRNYIAETYGQATGLEDIDSMSDAEAEERIKQVYDSHLSTFAKFLNEEANVLAGKTALIDRGIEGIIGRRGITFLNTLNRQVGSNMVGYNVSSSLTNFLPVAQTFAKTNKFDFTKAFAQTVANKLRGGRFDSFAEDSPVVIRRKGEDRFYRTAWQKMADPGYALMGMVDDISTEIIARTKYNEFTRKGMDSQKAHFETDKWVSKLMGDRSLGQQPQLYNSKMLGLVTKFQLEVRNQLDSQFYDTIQETKASNEHIQNGLARNAKTAAKVASVFTQLAVAQHLYGMAFESIAGYNPAFDIIEVLMTAFGFDDEEDSEDTVKDNLGQGFEAFMEDLPYASIVTGGGRIPISSALPIKEFFKGEDQYGNEKSRWKIAGEVAPYYLMPGGYGQAKKTVQGLKMFSDDHPIAGSYTEAGNLRFPVEDTPVNRIKAGIFGQYASENARKYFDQEQRTLNPEQTEIFAGLDIPIEEYWEYRDSYNEFKELNNTAKEAAFADDATDKDALKYAYTDAVYDELSSLYKKQKELAGGNSRGKTLELRQLQKQMEEMLSESKYALDSMRHSGAYAEIGSKRFDYNAENDKWYEIKPKNSDGSDNWYYQMEQEVTKGLGISYEQYWNNREEYNFAYEKPEKYAVAKAIGGYDFYQESYDILQNWKSDNYLGADKDAKGNSISGSRKNKVIDYINGLDADYGEKIILYRTVYSSNADKRAYNQDIIDYLNERDDISYQEMKTILEELEMEVDSEGYITW